MGIVGKIVAIVPFPEQGQSGLMQALRLLASRMKTAHGKWRARRNSRRALAHLTEYVLRDIGLTRGQAREEYRRSFYLD